MIASRIRRGSLGTARRCGIRRSWPPRAASSQQRTGRDTARCSTWARKRSESTGHRDGGLRWRTSAAAASGGGWCCGGNMVFRRALFEGGFRFRESLGAGSPLDGGEELYGFFSILRSGGAIEYVPDAIVRHDGPGDSAGGRKAWKGSRRYGAYVAM